MFAVSPLGSTFSGMPVKVSRGPWFKEYFAHDDGLEYYYKFSDSEGKTKYLLSNNLPWQDRESIDRLYKGMQRSSALCFFAGTWLGVETFLRVPRLRSLGVGLKVLAFITVQSVWSALFASFGTVNYQGPLISAYLTKYERFAKEDLFEIKDEKREWFEIDTSDYLNYSFEDLHHAHAHHGPQPDDMVLNNSWLVEMEKYLKGEESNIKNDPRFLHYDFQYTNNGQWPTEEDITKTFTAPSTNKKTPESLKKKEH